MTIEPDTNEERRKLSRDIAEMIAAAARLEAQVVAIEGAFDRLGNYDLAQTLGQVDRALMKARHALISVERSAIDHERP